MLVDVGIDSLAMVHARLSKMALKKKVMYRMRFFFTVASYKISGSKRGGVSHYSTPTHGCFTGNSHGLITSTSGKSGAILQSFGCPTGIKYRGCRLVGNANTFLTSLS